MSIGKLVSSLAVAAVLAFPGAAMAQTMIGDKVIPEDQLEAVNQKCTELTTESLSSTTEDDATASTEQEEGESADPADPNAIDLETLTAELCREAGLPTPYRLKSPRSAGSCDPVNCIFPIICIYVWWAGHTSGPTA